MQKLIDQMSWSTQLKASIPASAPWNLVLLNSDTISNISEIFLTVDHILMFSYRSLHQGYWEQTENVTGSHILIIRANYAQVELVTIFQLKDFSHKNAHNCIQIFLRDVWFWFISCLEKIIKLLKQSLFFFLKWKKILVSTLKFKKILSHKCRTSSFWNFEAFHGKGEKKQHFPASPTLRLHYIGP